MNNTQIIESISGSSTHPHAKLIAEWLLTGKVVEYLLPGTVCWIATDSPSWKPNTLYRLVTPKVATAYRVYRYIGERGTNTQDRYEDGELSHIGDESSIVWMSNWIEYTTDKEDIQPLDLLRQIVEVDLTAAKWLKDNYNIFGEIYDAEQVAQAYLNYLVNYLRSN